MAAIHSSNTRPEIYFRKLLFARGCRYRISESKIPGHPDIFLGRYHTAVFVHGCFWHHHQGCRFAYTPKSRVDFWLGKFERNIQRDRTVSKELEKRGIKQLIIWECTLKRMKKDEALREQIIDRSIEFFHSDEQFLEL